MFRQLIVMTSADLIALFSAALQGTAAPTPGDAIRTLLKKLSVTYETVRAMYFAPQYPCDDQWCDTLHRNLIYDHLLTLNLFICTGHPSNFFFFFEVYQLQKCINGAFGLPTIISDSMQVEQSNQSDFRVRLSTGSSKTLKKKH